MDIYLLDIKNMILFKISDYIILLKLYQQLERGRKTSLIKQLLWFFLKHTKFYPIIYLKRGPI